MYKGKDFPTVELSIKDGELHVGKAERHTVCVKDFDTAIQRILGGETVHVIQNGPLVTQLQKTLRLVLGAK